MQMKVWMRRRCNRLCLKVRRGFWDSSSRAPRQWCVFPRSLGSCIAALKQRLGSGWLPKASQRRSWPAPPALAACESSCFTSLMPLLHWGMLAKPEVSAARKKNWQMVLEGGGGLCLRVCILQSFWANGCSVCKLEHSCLSCSELHVCEDFIC